nr:BspA family leucine-rich repeat surface protein [bacterium]
MQYMFNECNGIVEINLSSFDTTKVTNMQQMF